MNKNKWQDFASEKLLHVQFNATESCSQSNSNLFRSELVSSIQPFSF